MNLQNKRLFVAGDLLKDLPFFGVIGLIFGLIQQIGFTFFDKADWGTELLLEHMSFKTLVMTVGAIVVIRITEERLSIKGAYPRLADLVNHLSSRAVALATVSATTLLGFGTAALITGYLGHAIFFGLVSMFFAAIAEFSVNPILRGGQSRYYPVAIGIIIGLPFSLQIKG